MLTVENDPLLISMLLLPLLNLPGVSLDCLDEHYQSLLVKVMGIVIQNIETQNPVESRSPESRTENCDETRSPESQSDYLGGGSPLSLNEECHQSRSVHQDESRSPLSQADKLYKEGSLMSPTVETYSYQVYHKLCGALDSFNIEQWLDEVENSLSSIHSYTIILVE